MYRRVKHKEALFSVLMISVLTLAACVQSPGAIGSPTPVTEVLQLTQTSAPIPSQEPTWVPLPTIALTPEATLASLPTFNFSDLPAPLTPLPTFAVSALRTPFPTETLSLPTLGPGTPETECFVTASKGGIQLRLGPSFSAYRLLPEMEPGVRYQAIDTHEQYYQLALDGIPVGWVQYLDVFPTEGLSTEGPGCDRLFTRPRSGPLTEFPGLCLFTATSPTETFQDSNLTAPFFISISPSSGPFVGLAKTRKSIFTLLSHAGPSFHAPLDKVSTSAACAGIPAPATVTTSGWLWSKPDEAMGEKLFHLTPGMRLHIEGNRPPDGSGQSAWVQAVVQEQPFSGWIWSGLVSFDGVNVTAACFPEPGPMTSPSQCWYLAYWQHWFTAISFYRQSNGAILTEDLLLQDTRQLTARADELLMSAPDEPWFGFLCTGK